MENEREAGRGEERWGDSRTLGVLEKSCLVLPSLCAEWLGDASSCFSLSLVPRLPLLLTPVCVHSAGLSLLASVPACLSSSLCPSCSCLVFPSPSVLSLLCVSLSASESGGPSFASYFLLPALMSADPTGLTTSPARGRLHCYTCSFATPCYPVPKECQEDEVCGVSVGTSGRTLVQWPFLGWLLVCLLSVVPAASTSAFLLCPTDGNEEVIERKGCLPRAQCPLLGRTTYWSQSYTLRHRCCEQDLCNRAASQRLPSLPLATLLLLAAIFGWRVHIFL